MIVFIICLVLLAVFLLNRLLCFFEYKKVSKLKNYQLVNGKKLYYYESGQGEDLMVFLSGSGVAYPFTDMQPLQTSELQKSCKLLVIDRIGSGLSDDIKDERKLDVISDEVMALIAAKKEANSRVFLVGHSLAGLIVMRMAQRYKDNINGILLIDSPSLINAANFKAPTPKFLLVLTKYGRRLGWVRIYCFLGRLLALVTNKNTENLSFQEIYLNKSFFPMQCCKRDLTYMTMVRQFLTVEKL